MTNTEKKTARLVAMADMFWESAEAPSQADLTLLFTFLAERNEDALEMLLLTTGCCDKEDLPRAKGA